MIMMMTMDFLPPASMFKGKYFNICVFTYSHQKRSPGKMP